MTEYALLILLESGEKPKRLISEIVSNFEYSHELRTTVRHAVVITRTGKPVAVYDRKEESHARKNHPERQRKPAGKARRR